MARNRAALSAILASLLLLAACGGPAPALRTYSLASSSIVRPPLAPTHPLPGVLTVVRFSADQVLNSRRIAWRSSPDAPTVGNYADHLWSEAPPAAMQIEIEHCLRDARAAETVVPDTAPAVPDWILSGRLIHFEQQLTGPAGPGNAQARVTAEFVLTNLRNSPQPVWQDTFDVAVPLPDASPEYVAEGMRHTLVLLCQLLVKRLHPVGLHHRFTYSAPELQSNPRRAQ